MAAHYLNQHGFERKRPEQFSGIKQLIKEKDGEEDFKVEKTEAEEETLVKEKCLQIIVIMYLHHLVSILHLYCLPLTECVRLCTLKQNKRRRDDEHENDQRRHK